MLFCEQTKVVANYNFKAEEPGELELQRGDIVCVTDKTDASWWQGEITRNGVTVRGMFPCNYVSPYN